MCNPQTSKALFSATSSRALAAGPTLFDSLAGPMTGKSGPEAAPVNRFRVPADAAGRRTNGTSGRNSTVSSASAALSASLASRLQARMASNGSMEYRLTWKNSVMPSGRVICRLRASGRRTSGNECSGWPSQSAQEPGGTAEQHLARKRACVERGIQMGCNAVTHLSLAAQLTGWPTPHAQEDNRTPEQYLAFKNKHGATNVSTLGVAAKLTGWRTPSAVDHEGGPMDWVKAKMEHLNPRMKLNAQAVLCGWVSPTAQDHSRGVKPPRPQDTGIPLSQQVAGLTACSSPAETTKSAGSVLNPAMSRFLMGFPATWDECSPGWPEWRSLQDTIASDA
jgi:hypothetical protein